MLTRHEEELAFAAAGEAALTGELAVCAGSCGSGNMHLINGLYDAHRSRVPVLAIAFSPSASGKTLSRWRISLVYSCRCERVVVALLAAVNNERNTVNGTL